MASAYGILHNYGKPDSLLNEGLTIKALSYKQEKYDSNLIKLEQAAERIGLSTQGMNAAGKEYTLNRLGESLNNISRNTSDLSRPDVTRNILSSIRDTYDDTVLTHMNNASAMQKLQQQAEKYQEDGDYAEQNYNDAFITSGLRDYYSNEDATDVKTISAPTMTPYVDYNAELMEKAAELNKLVKRDSSFDVLDEETGMITRTTYKTATPDQWKTYLKGFISEPMRKQMAIDAKSRFNWDENKARESQANLYTSRISLKDEQIKNIDTIIKAEGITGKKLEVLQKSKTELEKEKENLQEILNKAEFKNYSIEDIAVPIMEDNLINSLSSIMGANYESKTITNPGIISTNRNIMWEREKLALKEQKEQDNFAEVTRLLDTNTDADEIDFTSVQAELSQTEEDLDTTYRQLYNNFDGDLKNLVDDKIESFKNDEKYKGLSESQLRIKAVESLDGEKWKNGANPELFERMYKLNDKIELQNRSINEFHQEYLNNSISNNSNQLYKALSERNNTKLDIEDENGSVIRYDNTQDFLDEYNITDAKDLENLDERVKKQLFKNIQQDFLFSPKGVDDLSFDFYETGSEKISNLNRKGVLDYVNRFLLGEGSSKEFREAGDTTQINPDTVFYFNNLVSSIGENKSMSDVFDFHTYNTKTREYEKLSKKDFDALLSGRKNNTYLNNGYLEIKDVPGNEKIIQTLNEGKERVGSLSGIESAIRGNITDRNLYRDKAIRENFDFKKVKGDFARDFMKSSDRFVTGKELVIDITDKKKSELPIRELNIALQSPNAESYNGLNKLENLDASKASTVSVKKVSGGYLVQQTPSSNNLEKGRVNSLTSAALIPERNFETAARNLVGRFDSLSDEKVGTIDRDFGVDKYSNEVKYLSDKTSVRNMAKYWQSKGLDQYASMATVSDSKENFDRVLQSLAIKGETAITNRNKDQYSRAYDKIIKNSHRFRTKIRRDEPGVFNVSLMYSDDWSDLDKAIEVSDLEFHSDDITWDNLNLVQSMTPQVLMNLVLKELVQRTGPKETDEYTQRLGNLLDILNQL